MKLDNPAALLFDFDGVLVESYQLHRDTWKQAYRNLFLHEMPEYPRDETSGLSPKKIARFLAADAGCEDQADALLQEKYRLVLDGDLFPPLYDGVKELMDQISMAHIPLAIVSNAKREYVEKVVAHYSLPVVNLFGLDDFSKPKPDKEPYYKTALTLGILENQFKRVYVFEDSMPGIQSAKAAGMIPVGVLTRHTAVEMKAAGVSHVIELVKYITI